MGKLFTHVPLVTKQYNLVQANGQWCSAAGKATVGLAESNGSLPMASVTCRLTAEDQDQLRNLRSFWVWDYLTFELMWLLVHVSNFGQMPFLTSPMTRGWHWELNQLHWMKMQCLTSEPRFVNICKYYYAISSTVHVFSWSLKHSRTEADKKFFNSISQPDSCLHHLLPPPRDTQLVTKLRYANTYPVLLVKTKRFCSFINFGLANYVD